MFTLLKMLPLRRLLAEQLPALAAAWVIAEMFFKWKSFSLEVAGFLAAWFVLDALIQGLRRAFGVVPAGLEAKAEAGSGGSH